MGRREDAEAAGVALDVSEKQKLLDRLVVGGVSVLGSAIVVAVVIFVVVDKMNQMPHTALVLLPDPFDNRVIRFRPNDNDTYAYYVTHLNDYIDGYSKKQSRDHLAVNCSAGRCPTGKKVCLFDIQQLGSHCVRQKNYGFDSGQPCMLVFFKPPMDWDPENFNHSTIPEPLRERWRPQHLGVHCEGQTEVDKHRMGSLEYWPPEGFPMAYFPYEEKPNFRPPLLMLRFLNPTPDVLINIRCQIHAANINPSMTQYYKNSFSFLMDTMEPHSRGALDNTTFDSNMNDTSMYNTSELYLNEAFNFSTVPFNTASYESTLPANAEWLNLTEAVPLTSTPRDYLENITMPEVTVISNSSHSSAETKDINNHTNTDIHSNKTLEHITSTANLDVNDNSRSESQYSSVAPLRT